MHAPEVFEVDRQLDQGHEDRPDALLAITIESYLTSRGDHRTVAPVTGKLQASPRRRQATPITQTGDGLDPARTERTGE